MAEQRHNLRLEEFLDGADAVDGTATIAMDGADTQTATADNHSPNVASDVVDNPNSNHVEAHWRTLPDGTQIWVDGDTSVHTYEGWSQSNPDYRVKG